MSTIKKKKNKNTTDSKNKIWNSMFFCMAYNALRCLGPAYFQPLAILSLQANRTVSVPWQTGHLLPQSAPTQGTTVRHGAARSSRSLTPSLLTLVWGPHLTRSHHSLRSCAAVITHFLINLPWRILSPVNRGAMSYFIFQHLLFFPSFNLLSKPMDRCWYCPHFTDEEIQALQAVS